MPTEYTHRDQRATWKITAPLPSSRDDRHANRESHCPLHHDMCACACAYWLFRRVPLAGSSFFPFPCPPTQLPSSYRLRSLKDRVASQSALCVLLAATSSLQLDHERACPLELIKRHLGIQLLLST